MQDLTTVPPARVPSPDTIRHRKAAGKNLTYLGPGDTIGEGDSDLVLDLLPAAFADQAFRQLQEEVQWAVMHHRGSEVPRLVAVQGQVAFDGSFPIYRHPADESPPLLPFTPTVLLIKEHVERVLNHPVNHVLIQLYRGGTDYISPHADKTIDVVHGSKIVNVSLGAERLMILRTKKDAALEPATIEPTKMGSVRNAQRIPLPHNSMFVLGLETNAKWLHGIRQDKRLPTEKTPSEVAFDGARISLTFRRIGTFLTADQSLIYGQGATGKTLETARPVINGVEDETNRLIMGFGNENQRSDFDWEAEYGRGSDVLHFVNEAAPAS
ncbi:hypothetical protein SISSUDRAFT_986262 [Sistotremastrum suecicum HHB10207 ss-3]|uniref:Fe2OG dioxygenase domain-containing protein n=1 Tax=Sistotremastrum suecicum HHB10207 ss-3 TaxID=1314776 RepID=A0A166DDA0_9AGAM|nr:hypothetical protein SISSUDRAFT_986262 [Sistotremastrum suecicum HHB10207 ss-3]